MKVFEMKLLPKEIKNRWPKKRDVSNKINVMKPLPASINYNPFQECEVISHNPK